MAAKGKDNSIGKLQKSYFDVLGLCCSSEVPLVENILKSLNGVKEVSVIVASRTVIVVHDNSLVSPNQIVKALNQARLEANVRVRGEDNLKQRWPSPYALACGFLLLLSLLKYVYPPLHWMALGAVVAGIFPIALKGIAALRNFRLDINILALIAVIGTIAMGDYFEAGTIVFLFSIAEWLESRASHKANAVMSSLISLTPQKAVLAETGEVVDADEVKINTILAVKAGEAIPIDGIVADGKCEVDEKTLTGESFPVAKQKDSDVWAGTLNLNGYISVKTTVLAEDCVVAKMAKLVEQAQNNKTRTQRFIDKCAKYYTPAVVLISASVAVIPVALRVHNLTHWFHFALVVLVSACPCALILSTPVATFCALTKAAKSGLLIKGGEYLEILAKLKIMAFDKTGTITRGEFVLTDFRSLCDDISVNTLIYWVSSIESKSSHPMAAALIEYGRLFSIEPKPEDVEDFQNFPGEGIHGRIDGKDIYVGNKKIALKAGADSVPMPEDIAVGGKTLGYIYVGAKPVGIFSLSDACRTGAVDAIKELKSLGIKTAMLTGDSHEAAMNTQKQLGNALDIVRAELLPQDKAKIIKEFKNEGVTAMIGDGVNDAPALATADIGISMGISGSALAIETGQIVLMSNDIRKVPKTVRLAKRAQRKIIENVILSVTTKTGILTLALAGHPLVWAAVLADVGTCLLVICNSMLLLQGTDNIGAKSCKSSAALHDHKHACKSSNCHTTHNTHHCCSSIKPKKCSPQGCASHCWSGLSNLTDCQNTNISNVVEKKNGLKCCDDRHSDEKCSDVDYFKGKSLEVAHHDSECCRKTNSGGRDFHGEGHASEHNMHNHNNNNSSSCKKEGCCQDVTERHTSSIAQKDGLLAGIKVCKHGHCDSEEHVNCSSGKNHADDVATGNAVECCHVQQQNMELKSCCVRHDASPHTAIDIIPEPHLEKGLSEIIID